MGMRCDLHVHSVHSGMCTVPVVGRFCRESYSQPEAVYERLKRLGMDLVTITDHDSIGAAEPLRRHADFFLSEEVTCRMPSGTELHVGVYDINERQHIEMQRRRGDLPRLIAYLGEQRLFYSANHIFSGLTGRRALEDFQCFETMFPAIETLNGHMIRAANEQAARFAAAPGKAPVGGSDAHTLGSAGSAYTEVAGARDRIEFLKGLRLGLGRARGESGGYRKLTREILQIALEMARENIALAPLLPVAVAIPAVTLACHLSEVAFAHRWKRALERARSLPLDALLPEGEVAGGGVV